MEAEKKSVSRGKKRSRIIIFVAFLIIVIGTVSTYFLLLSSSTVKSLGCTPNSTLASGSSTAGQLASFPVTCIEISAKPNGSIILDGFAYVAQNQAQQEQGFQNVTSFGNCNGFAVSGAPCVGMLFSFSSTQQLCFWMHNTEIPLQQDWIAANGTVLYQYQAKPENDTSVCFPAKYVLETSPSSNVPLGSLVHLGTNSSA